MGSPSIQEDDEEIERIRGLRSDAAIRQDKRKMVVDALELATVALRDAGIAYKRAQAAYQEALQAFNRFVAPDPEVK